MSCATGLGKSWSAGRFFQRKGVECGLNGLFNEKGIIGVLEASDYKQVDKVLPFLEVIVDYMCGLNIIASTSNVFASYVDLANTFYERCESLKCKENDFIQLREQVCNFIDIVVANLGPYQTSSARASKFHILNYVIQDLRDMRGIAYIQSGQYKKTHKIFKYAYGQAAKRHGTATDETIRRSGIRKSYTERITKTSPQLPLDCTARSVILIVTCRHLESLKLTSIIDLYCSSQKLFHTQ